MLLLAASFHGPQRAAVTGSEVIFDGGRGRTSRSSAHMPLAALPVMEVLLLHEEKIVSTLYVWCVNADLMVLGYWRSV
jgi:hypothetical protein